MRIPLLCAAAALACAMPAAASAAFEPPVQRFAADGGAGVRIHRDRGGMGWRDGDDRRGGRRDGRHEGSPFGYGYGDGYYYAPGEWARYNNRSWEADSFNDWWHDRPNRSMPRWTQSNGRECRQQYWTSAGWTC